ncbi:MAG TPA: hypothetical protein VL123_03955 [Candidatus Udaeobacter sp.]|jgi:hypothetical protein|nr:hypothetical protein [Candidatus Udaeobacter sp.]
MAAARARIGVLVAALLISGCTTLLPQHKIPRDEVLRRHFAAHRAAFEKLAAMAEADSDLISVSNRWHQVAVYARVRGSMGFLSDDDLRATHRMQYGPLLRAAEMHYLAHSGPDQPVSFLVWAGVVKKGILYSPSALTPVRATLDSIDENDPHLPQYVELAPHWYIFLWPHD